MHKSGSAATHNLMKRIYNHSDVCFDNHNCKNTDTSTLHFSRVVNLTFVRNILRDRKVKSCKIVAQIRHPIDALVSMFNSFTTNNHAFSSNLLP